MGAQNTDLLLNMFPEFRHIVERICTPNWKIPKGRYQWHNIILVYDGESTFHCNGEEFKASKGDMIYYKPGDIRWANTHPQKLMKCFAVDFMFTCPQRQNDNWVLNDVPLPFSSHQKIHDQYLLMRLLDLFHSLANAQLSGNPNKVIRCRAIFMEIINILLWKKTDGINYDKYRKVEIIINFMTEHYSNRIKLDELCDLIKVSSSYLLEIFKEVTGKSPINYLIHMRMEKSKELLKDGYTVTEAAQKVGFDDVLYFSKCFKKLEGMNPSEYKKKRI